MAIPSTTRQWYLPQIGSYHNLVFTEVPLAPPQTHEVLIKTHAVSLQFRDLLIPRGVYPGPIAPNLVPGSDAAGEVIAVGDSVTQWKVGDRVCPNFFLDKFDKDTPPLDSALGASIHGVLTEYRSYPANSLVAIPSHLSYEEASTLPCAGLTAYSALFSGFTPVKAGDTVLVQGTGGVSIFALQFAVASGATVIVTSSSDEKLKIATRLGAKHVINYKTYLNWDEEVLRLTGGLGVDRVLEVAGNATLKQSLASVKSYGSIDIIGIVGSLGDFPAVDIVVPTIKKGLRIRGIGVGSVPEFKDMNKLMSANIDATRPVVDKIFPFLEVKAGLAYLESQGHVGKIVIKI
ncbi:alcohol dehydrogenase superfamily protein [Mycena rebaudengoi]|nr:alcohol dehydrogenase superfamily protein [Mycena rebaudengoi]